MFANWREKQITAFLSFPQYIWSLPRCIQNLKAQALIGFEKSVTQNLIGEKEKWTTIGMYKEVEAGSLFITIQNTIHTICTKFQNPGCRKCQKSFDTKFLYVLRWNREIGKRQK